MKNSEQNSEALDNDYLLKDEDSNQNGEVGIEDEQKEHIEDKRNSGK